MISIISYVIATTVANMISWIADIMLSSMLQGPSRFMASAPPDCVHFLGQRTSGRGVREHWAGSEQLQAAISSFWAWPESSGLSTCQDFASFVIVCVGCGLRVAKYPLQAYGQKPCQQFSIDNTSTQLCAVLGPFIKR